ncbi:tyrosine-type recombinase/integrase [[Clostridium] leptum]|nr:tyrosine-type recombinase/integrase [[Clostridium] leptum]
MSEKRRDNRNRVLYKGESQKKNGLYVYKYVDMFGKPKYEYSWRLVATDRLPKGKRECRPLREKEQEIQRDRADGIDSTGKQMTVCQLYEKQTRCRPNVRRSTKRGRAQLMRILQEDKLGAASIGSVKPSDAKEWALRMKRKGYAYNTINNHKRSLKAAFYMAVQDDCIRKNPFDFALSAVLDDDREATEPLSSAQEASFVGFMREDTVYRRYYDEVVILLGTGLRISEMCGLTERDIDIGRSLVRIDYQLLRGDADDGEEGRYVEKPKTRKGGRVIAMSTEVAAAFRRVLRRRLGAREHASIGGRKGFLFLNRNGKPRVAADYEAVFRRAVAKYRKGGGMELPKKVTPHTMRHTFCTNMANAGMNPKALQYIMGHSDIKMTLGYYAHTTSETAVDEMRRFIA